jgi:hypothetical protein
MRITRDILRKVATNTAAERTRYNRHLVCIFLTGSLLEEDPMLGGTADVDLIFVHDGEPPFKREIVPVTDDIHVDIGHLSQSVFLHPRALRGEAWLGPFICNNPVLLHDTQHWFEFTQSSVCAQFNQPENVLRRARPLAEGARQSWMKLHGAQKDNWEKTVCVYLNILKNAANSIACLSGAPLTERRFMLQFPERADEIGHPELANTLAALFTGQPISDEDWTGWLDAWETAFNAVGGGENPPARLHPARRNYYRKAAISLWENDEKAAALWPILQTWTEAITFSQNQNESACGAWRSAVQHLGLSEADLSGRVDALDGYLDQVEETLDVWAEEHGA